MWLKRLRKIVRLFKKQKPLNPTPLIHSDKTYFVHNEYDFIPKGTRVMVKSPETEQGGFICLDGSGQLLHLKKEWLEQKPTYINQWVTVNRHLKVK